MNSDPMIVFVDQLWRILAFETVRATVWTAVGVFGYALAKKVGLF